MVDVRELSKLHSKGTTTLQLAKLWATEGPYARTPQRIPRRHKPTITERTLIEKQLAQSRSPQEKAYYLQQLRETDRLERERQRLKNLRKQLQEAETTEVVEQPETEKLVSSLLELGPDDITSDNLSKVLTEIISAKQYIENLPEGTKITIGNREVSKQEAIRQLEDYYEQIGMLQNKLRKEGNLHFASYQDPETKEWQTVAVSRQEARELGIWTQSYKEAENLYNQLIKEGPNLDKIAYTLGGFIDPTDPLRIKTITTMITSKQPKKDVIKVIADSKFKQYTAREGGISGILSYTIQMPIIQYGLSVVGGVAIGGTVGAISGFAPKLGSAIRTGTKAGLAVGATYAGYEGIKAYERGGIPELSATATRLGIGLYGGYKGYKLGYPSGYKFGTSYLRASEYNLITGRVRGGIGIGKRGFYWKSRPMSETEIRYFYGQTYDPTAVEMPPYPKYAEYRPKVAGLLPGKVSPTTYTPSQARAIDISQASTLGQRSYWQPKEGIPYQSEYPLSTFLFKKPTLWIRPGKLSTYPYPYSMPTDFTTPMYLETGVSRFVKKPLISLRLKKKPRIYTFKDIIKLYEPPKGAQVSGQRQKLIQLQKQVKKQEKVVAVTEQKLATAQKQALKLKQLLSKKLSLVKQQELRQEQILLQARVQEYAQLLAQEKSQLYATVQLFEQAQSQRQEFAVTPMYSPYYEFKKPEPTVRETPPFFTTSTFTPFKAPQKQTNKTFGLPVFEEEKKKPKKQQSYHVYINGKRRTPQPLKKQTALGYGADITDKTTATRFRLQQVKSSPSYNPQYATNWNRINYKFKKSGNTYYEKKQYQKDFDIERGVYVAQKPQKPRQDTKKQFFSIVT